MRKRAPKNHQKIRLASERLEARSRALRQLLRLRVAEIQRLRLPPRAAKLAEEVVGLTAWYRLQAGDWEEVYEADRAALLGATAGALLAALDCGMSRPEFAAWLRRTADSLASPTTSTTKGA